MKDNLLHQEVLELVNAQKTDEAIAIIDEHYFPKKSWKNQLLNRKKQKDDKGKFAYGQLKAFLHNLANPPAAEQSFAELELETDYVFEIAELSSFYLDLKPELEELKLSLEKFLTEIFLHLSSHIREASNNYPEQSISAKVWMDGHTLRYWIEFVLQEVEKRGNLEREIELAFYKAKVTLSIMAHYPENVGPDMVRIAKKYESAEDYENASRFYQPATTDFKVFLEEIESYTEEEDFELEEREHIILDSLVQAVEGKLRTDKNYVDEYNLLERAKALLNKA